jgi:gamma-glutamyltranspeptidase/glutathione hydrolase
MIDFGLDVQAAGEVPRFRHQGSSDVDGHRMTDGGIVHLEHGFGDAALAGLERRGHRLAPDPKSLGGSFGGYQGIFFDRGRGVLLGGSDRRKDGCAVGVD